LITYAVALSKVPLPSLQSEEALTVMIEAQKKIKEVMLFLKIK